MTLGDLVTLEPALTRLGDQPMPAKTRYHVARLIAAVRVETKHYATERDTIGRELGTVEPNGNWAVALDSPNLKVFFEKHKELTDVEVVIDKWLLTYEMLDTFTLSPNDEIALLPLIVPKA